jgi:hypothetical protein
VYCLLALRHTINRISCDAKVALHWLLWRVLVFLLLRYIQLCEGLGCVLLGCRSHPLLSCAVSHVAATTSRASDTCQAGSKYNMSARILGTMIAALQWIEEEEEVFKIF